MTNTTVEEITSDASMRRVAAPIVVSGLLSTITAITDSMSLVGIAGRVAKTLADAEPSASSLTQKLHLSNTWVIMGSIGITLILNMANTAVREKVTADWNAARRLDMISAYRAADFSTQANYSGAALSVATEQIAKAAGAIGSMAGLINTVARTAIYIAVSFYTSWQVSVICVVFGGFLVVMLRLLSRRTRIMHRGIARRSIDNAEEIGEMAAASRELHILNRWEQTERRISRNIEKIRHLGFRAAYLAGLVGPIYWAGTLLVGLGVAIWTEHNGLGGGGGLATSGILLIRSLGAAQGAQVMYQSLNDARPYVDRVLAVIAELRLARRDSTGLIGEHVLELDIDHAALSYGNDIIVGDLDLRLKGPGGIAIIGPSGSGKTTTLLALSGLIDPSSGSINLAGVPLSLLLAADLGHHIGLLPQDPQLLRDDLRSNVTRPETEVDDETIRLTFATVGLEQTVGGFGGDLETLMGRAGEGFSGGELQRLGLARLLINQPDIWLLDEPTSALDRANSLIVCDLISEAMKTNLVIVVTHRPELLHHCGRIIYMENGVVIDDGPLYVVRARQPFVNSMLHSGAENEPTSSQSGSATSS